MNAMFRPEKGFFDHILSGLGCACAGFAIGMSLSNVTLAFFVAAMAPISTLIGYLLSRSIGDRPLLRFDVLLWTITALGCFFFVRPLNLALPGDPFEFNILIAATLCWMLILCPIFSWRDQTLLFLTLPSLALFGLVGLADYIPGTWLFFIYLLAAGVLYARVHQRSMLIQAERAGEGRYDLLQRGPWKWMAGPEWAMASGFVIVCLSVLGAPLIQMSVQGVAGQVNVSLPQQNNQPSTSAAATQLPETRVGNGPTDPTDTPVFTVKIDEPMLLRSDSYTRYLGTGWGRRQINIAADSPFNNRVSMPDDGGVFEAWPNGHPPGIPIKQPRQVHFEIAAIQQLSRTVISPGIINIIESAPSSGYFNGFGDFILSSNQMKGSKVSGAAVLPRSRPYTDADARADTPDELDNLYNSEERISPRIRELAQQVIRDSGAQTDFEKAEALQAYITKTVKYNLRAPAVPSRTDAAEFFLFESKEGYCDLFATTMVCMARSAGFPARYTLGYLINNRVPDQRTGTFTIRERDYHAWCEIYFEGYGWIPFDATEGAVQVQGGERGSAIPQFIPFFERESVQIILRGLLIVALVLPLLIYIGRQIIRSRKVLRENEVIAVHAQFTRAIEKLHGSPKRFSVTTREYVASAGEHLGELRPRAEEISQKFEQALYGPNDQGQMLAVLKTEVADFRKAIKAAQRSSR